MVEAALLMPLFFLAVLFLISMIPVIRNCERVVYSSAEELRVSSVRAHFTDDRAALAASLCVRARKGNPSLSAFHIRQIRWRYRENGIDDRILVSFTAVFHGEDPLSLFRTYRFRGTVAGRAFTGADTVAGCPETDFEEDGEERTVYVFPDRGTHYHRKSCRFLSSCCLMTPLTPELKKKYRACRRCRASRLQPGSEVYVFPGNGESYHRRSCRSVTKYYVAMQVKEAKDKGYRPCTVCGR